MKQIKKKDIFTKNFQKTKVNLFCYCLKIRL